MPTPDFIAHVTALASQAGFQGAAASIPGVIKRKWNIPPAFPAGVDVRDPDGFVVGCDRAELNSACVAEYQAAEEPNSGRIGAVGAYKTAIDYQAAYERALHARHASGLRLRVWASARRTGHSDLTYGVFGCAVRSIEASIAASRSVPNSQEA